MKLTDLTRTLINQFYVNMLTISLKHMLKKHFIISVKKKLIIILGIK